MLAFGIFFVKWYNQSVRSKSEFLFILIVLSHCCLICDLIPSVVCCDLAIPSHKEKFAKFVLTTLLTSNFIGIVFARTLHYQFYSWYFYSLPYLLWQTNFPIFMRVIMLLVIEVCFNVYPARPLSSLCLQVRYLMPVLIYFSCSYRILLFIRYVTLLC